MIDPREIRVLVEERRSQNRILRSHRIERESQLSPEEIRSCAEEDIRRVFGHLIRANPFVHPDQAARYAEEVRKWIPPFE